LVTGLKVGGLDFLGVFVELGAVGPAEVQYAPIGCLDDHGLPIDSAELAVDVSLLVRRGTR
jgi:hypothetical protein